MRFNRLDLNLLVALDALFTERSVSRAAERMHLSQSAMSNALNRLREYFDDELLVQVGRRMDLTPRAQALKEAVHDVLLRVDTTIASQPQFDPARSEREFRLLVSDYATTMLMPHVLSIAHRQSSTVRFHFLPQVPMPHCALERGEADVLVIPADYCSPDHPVEVLFEESFCCVAWSEGRFARRRLDKKAYLAAGHVVVTPGGAEDSSFEARFVERHGIARRVEVTTFSFVAAPALVVGTDRIATVHARLARHARRSLPLKLLAAPLPVPAIREAMQWHRYRTQDPGLVWLRGLLHQAALLMDAK